MSQGYTRNTLSANIPTGATGTVLQGAGAGITPVYSTATYPSTAGTSGKILVSDGTNIVSSTPTFPNASATSRKMIVSDGTNWVASTETWAVPGTSGNVLTSNGTNWTSAAPATTFVKQVRTSASAVTCTTAMPIGGGTQTQGTQIMTVSITPAASANILVFEVWLNIAVTGNSTSTTNDASLSLFQGATSANIAANTIYINDGAIPAVFAIDFQQDIRLLYSQAAGTTSSTTFKIRAGNSLTGGAGAPTTVVQLAAMTITEYTS